MKELLEKLQTRIDEQSLRERVLLFLAIIAVLYMLWQSLLMGPLEAEQKQLLGRLDSVRKEITALEQQTQIILKRRTIDPDAENRRLLAQYQEQIQQLEKQISESIRGLIKPQQMARVLESVLTRETDLTLVGVKNLQPELLVKPEDDQNDIGMEGAGVYKHGLQLMFTGKYLSGLDYLRALEQLPWGFHWDGIEITMDEYPNARIVVTVHTLSLDEGWIGV